jgi:hypothetical protein
VIPLDVFAEIPPGEHDENAQRDHFLDDFQLEGGELPVTDAVRRNLKTIFRERYQPAHHDRGEKRRLAVFQVPVLGDRHEDIGAKKKQNGFHGD